MVEFGLVSPDVLDDGDAAEDWEADPRGAHADRDPV